MIARVALILCAALFAPLAAFGAAEDQLLDAIVKDPSFKVRMQAIRVLTKRITATKRPASDKALTALQDAANKDESYLVRGLACFSLGQLGDGRVRSALEKAQKDEHPFVREQATEALRQVPTAGPEPGVALKPLPLPGRNDATSASTQNQAAAAGGPRALVLTVEQPSESAIPRESLDRLRSGLEDRLRTTAPRQFQIGNHASGRGFQLAGSIADRRVEDTREGKARITMVVRVTISTWPENHLRHVVTARATAETASNNESGRARLEQRVLDAAVRQAVDEALAEISRE